MKKMILAGLLLLGLCATAGCSRGEDNISFTAQVDAVYEDSLQVETKTQGLSFSSADVDISGLELDFVPEPGQTLSVTILPTIRETSPVMVTAVRLRLLKESETPGTPMPARSDSDIPGVSMTISSGSVNSGGLTLTVNDTNNPPHDFGQWYELDRLDDDGRWLPVPVVIEGDYGFDDQLLDTDEFGQLTLEIDWRWLYGELEPGAYKIVKSLEVGSETKYFSAEFKIGSPARDKTREFCA